MIVMRMLMVRTRKEEVTVSLRGERVADKHEHSCNRLQEAHRPSVGQVTLVWFLVSGFQVVGGGG